MDPVLLTALIVLIVLICIGLYLLLDGGTGLFHRKCTSPPGTPFIIGEHFSQFDDVEANGGTKPKESDGAVVGAFMSHMHRGSQSLHAQGLCNVGGGAWGTVTSPTGRPAGPNYWSPVSGGIYDTCQCEDNGGLH